MESKEIINTITKNGGTITFIFNDKKCGCEAETINNSLKYILWYGEKEKTFNNIEDMIVYPMFDNKNIMDATENNKVEFY